MLILQGPDLTLRRQVRTVIERLNDFAEFPHPIVVEGETKRVDLRHLVNVVHADHERQVRDGFETGLTAGDPALYMLGMALAATGSLVVLCGVNTREETRELTFGGVLPCVPITYAGPDVLAVIMEAWEEEQQKTAVTSVYWSSGGCPEAGTMVVGEANQDLVACKRRAFISHTGCSRFLQECLAANGHQRYYLTNAKKSGIWRRDLLALSHEVEVVRPQRIVAMGTEAAKHLNALKVTFTQTYHPQYWKRFRYHQQHELTELLK